jgi:xylose dehydrogenase (NAD/NADP)
VLGAADIADRALLPALEQAAAAEPLAIASRDPDRARDLARRHRLERVHADYASLLADPDVDAVYVPLPNALHRTWALRALEAGKHVLCEKPLALDAGQAEEMAAAAERAGRLLMEALMYRFHPRMRCLRASLEGVPIRRLEASFAFRLRGEGYRLRPELGGGALLDVGCYLVDLVRWLLGEPERVAADRHLGPTGVDLSCSALLGFPGGAVASLYASFEAPEHQELTVVTEGWVVRQSFPFTAWRDPDDPYRLMVEAFSRAAMAGEAAPLPLRESIATLRVLDRIRAA